MNMKKLNAEALIGLTNSNAQSLISTEIDNAITLEKYPYGFPIRTH